MCLKMHLKNIENEVFIKNPWNKKDCWDILWGIFDFFKNNLLKASSTYLSFSKSGTFGHPAVRIRVKVMCSLFFGALTLT
jgi:hypothetical protein